MVLLAGFLSEDGRHPTLNPTTCYINDYCGGDRCVENQRRRAGMLNCAFLEVKDGKNNGW